jgi:3-oxoacyl-[acyl-carrier protein] reductase
MTTPNLLDPPAIAIVTGGSGALGSAITRGLVRRGNKVVIGYLSGEQAARALADELGAEHVELVRADLADRDAPAALLDAACARWSHPTILVNNGGLMTRAHVAEMSDDTWDHLIDINLSSAFRVARAVIPGMIATGAGRIINVSSQAAYRGSIGRAHYSAAKAGLLGFTFALARELGPSGITVNAVVPGRIESDMVSAHSDESRVKDWLEETPLGRLGTPEELASAVCYLSSAEASYVLDQDVWVAREEHL